MVPRSTYNVKERSGMTAISARDTVPLVLDLRLLETFREVAARGSFSAAAEALTFTQPAVSQHVARLEKQIGTKLFDRDARGVTPTRAGMSLLRHAEALLESARRAEAEVRAPRPACTSRGPHRLVRVRRAEHRPARAARAALRPPGRPPAAEDRRGRGGARGALAGRIDVALLIGTREERVPLRAGLVGELILEDPMLVALPRAHPLAHQGAVSLRELRDEQWLITCDSSTCQDHLIVRRAWEEAGFSPSIHFESDDYQTLLGLTASGMGVAIVPSLAALSVPADVAVRPIPGDPPKRYISVARRAGETDMAVDAALDAMRIAGRRLSMGVVPSPAVPWPEPGDAAAPRRPGPRPRSSARTARCCALAHALLPSQVAVWRLSAGFMTTRVIGTLAEHGVFDALDDGPARASELAAAPGRRRRRAAPAAARGGGRRVRADRPARAFPPHAPRPAPAGRRRRVAAGVGALPEPPGDAGGVGERRPVAADRRAGVPGDPRPVGVGSTSPRTRTRSASSPSRCASSPR